MISIFDTDIVTFEKPKYTLEVRSDGFTYTHKKKGVLNVSFDDILTIITTNYFNSNGSYIINLVRRLRLFLLPVLHISSPRTFLITSVS